MRQSRERKEKETQTCDGTRWKTRKMKKKNNNIILEVYMESSSTKWRKKLCFSLCVCIVAEIIESNPYAFWHFDASNFIYDASLFFNAKSLRMFYANWRHGEILHFFLFHSHEYSILFYTKASKPNSFKGIKWFWPFQKLWSKHLF